MSEIFFISDTHFGHENVIHFDRRPFSSIEEHDEALIQKWNNQITDNDVVWILGDFSWKNHDKTIEILSRLRGRKCITLGNHDQVIAKNRDIAKFFDEVCPFGKELQVNNKMVVLSHYPMPCFKNAYHGWEHFYGHIHNGKDVPVIEEAKSNLSKLYGMPWPMYNVGCMMPYMNYTPQTFETIVKSNVNSLT